MDDCLFCNIVDRKIPATIVFEDDWCLCFQDIHPTAPTHLLLIPKLHIENLLHPLQPKEQEAMAHTMQAIPTIASEQGLDKGFRLIANSGEHSHQEVYHLHFHILGGEKLKGSII